MSTAVSALRASALTLVLTALFASLGCHAQPPASTAGTPLSPEVHRRVEILLRSKLNVPPDYTVDISPRLKSEVPNFDAIQVVFSSDGKSSKPALFLISADGRTLAQFNKFDLSQDPRATVLGGDRPARGGTESAPVLIVGFDDLECPYCAKMHAQLFPALLDRYRDQVRIVYRDFPLSQHPWAVHAAVDVNCLAAQSPEGYWRLVDYIHAHAAEIGGADKAAKTIEKAATELDTLTRDEGRRDHLRADALEACIQKQDRTAIDASLKLGESLGIEATPVLYINGEKLEGAYPIENVYRMIDEALLAQGIAPPAAKPAATAPNPTTAAKPGT